MTGPSDAPASPEGVPDHLAAELAELSPEELRDTIIHARELLQFHEERETPIEPGTGEDVVRATEREGYTEVVKRVSCADGCGDCPHGPYLYHVREEARPEGGTHLHWTFVGEARSDGE